MAANVYGDATRKLRVQRRDALEPDDVVQKCAEFNRVLGHVLPVRAVRRRVRSHVQRAAARQHDGALVARETAYESVQRRLTRAFETRIRARLPATRRARRDVDINAEPLQYPQRGDGDLWIELIDVAGREESERHYSP